MENDFSNIPWGPAADSLEGLYSAQIQQACEANRCFGTPVNSPNITNCHTDVPSSGSSLTPPLVFKLFILPWKDRESFVPQLNFFQVENFPLGKELILHQNAQFPAPQNLTQETLNAFYQEQESLQPSSAGLFFSSAVRGAAYTFGLEMIRDGLEQVGLSKRMANIATTMAQVGMVAYTATSYVPTIAGMAINSSFTYLGVPPSVSSALGTTAAIAASVSSGESVSPLYLMVSIGGGLVGSTLALKAKNKLSSWLFEKKDLKPSVPNFATLE